MTTLLDKQCDCLRASRKTLSTRIPKLVAANGPKAVRAALIECWLRSNRLSRRDLCYCEQTQKFLDQTSLTTWQPVCEKLSDGLDELSLKDVERGLELLNGSAKRRQHGIVYTPDDVIDYLLTSAFCDCESRSKPPVICDPACGSGGFLLRAAHLLSECYKVSFADALQQYVVGIDRDSNALANARCLIELTLAQRGALPLTGELRLLCFDSLLTSPGNLFSLAGVEQGFSIIASNPPYVKLQSLDQNYRRHLEEEYRPYIKGNYSLALLFMIAGHRMLAEGGSLAYITQNNLFTSLAGEPVRRYLQQQKCLRRILNFGHAKVFDKAAAYTCLVFLGTKPQDHVEYGNLNERPTRESLSHVEYSRILLTKLSPRKWRLAKPCQLENLERIESLGTPLGEVAEIRVGFATLKDSVFLVRDAGDHCLGSGVDGEEVVVEREITRPAVKIADVTDEAALLGNRVRILFPYCRSSRGYELLSEEHLRHEFPCAYAHLRSCRELLDSRDKGKKKAEAWYAWGRTQGRDAPGPKLLTKTFDRQPNFMLDRSDQLFCNGYSIALKSDSPSWLTIELLQTLLNSPVMHYYAKLTSFQIAGGYQCYQKNFIERFGIPSLNQEVTQQLMALSHDTRDQHVATELYGLSLDEVRETAG